MDPVRPKRSSRKEAQKAQKKNHLEAFDFGASSFDLLTF
jgi:hypothetical protein